jgi:hypothetical protein
VRLCDALLSLSTPRNTCDTQPASPSRTWQHAGKSRRAVYSTSSYFDWMDGCLMLARGLFPSRRPRRDFFLAVSPVSSGSPKWEFPFWSRTRLAAAAPASDFCGGLLPSPSCPYIRRSEKSSPHGGEFSAAAAGLQPGLIVQREGSATRIAPARWAGPAHRITVGLALLPTRGGPLPAGWLRLRPAAISKSSVLCSVQPGPCVPIRIVSGRQQAVR